MNERTFNGFMLSAALHGLVAVLLFVTFVIGQQASKNVPKVLELVAGEGDNYMATEAPALGTPGGIKLALPDVPIAKPTPKPPEPSPVEQAPEPAPKPVVERAPPTPVTKAPATVVEKKAPPIPNFAKDVKRIADKRAARLEAIDKKKREAEERAEKARELAKKKMTIEEFRAQNRAEAAAKNGGKAPKVSHVDVDGITTGVRGGSTANKKGAGGTALTREEGDEIDGYVSLLARKIKSELDERPGVGAGLVVEVEIHIMADGSITGFRITRSSGSSDFDQAVKEAMAIIELPARPKGLSEVQRFPIRGVE
jgi:colicin import membrane protein